MDNVITPEFVAKYTDKTPPWGFNGMGEIVYRRTYSRDIEALGRKESVSYTHLTLPTKRIV